MSIFIIYDNLITRARDDNTTLDSANTGNLIKWTDLT